jgi:hypothetical protein
MNFKKILFDLMRKNEPRKSRAACEGDGRTVQAEIVALHVVHYPIAYYTPRGAYLAESIPTV